jgi:ribosome maturation factor RimP
MYMDLLQLESELDEFLYRFGYEVIDLQVGRGGAGTLFRLFIDRVDHEPVTLNDCAAVAPQVELFLEQKRLYNDNCSLEVSSGGLDRVLKRNRDLERHIGSMIRATFFETGKRRTVEGELASFTDDLIVLLPQGVAERGESLSIPRNGVEKVRLVPQVEF